MPMQDQPDRAETSAVYGEPLAGLAPISAAADQVSPLHPSAVQSLDAYAPGALDVVVLAAPAGTLERRYVLAAALRALSADGVLTAMARKDRGGARLRKELEGFGCSVVETAKSHHRICVCRAPVEAAGVGEALAAGGLQFVPSTGLWSQPGVFSWDRQDPGSALLARSLPPLSGVGADLGCGIGALAHTVLASPKVSRLFLVDKDRRAIDAARRNIDDPRVEFRWADALAEASSEPGDALTELDFIVTNPPFHAAGTEDRDLGQAFLRRAMGLLRPKGVCWIVANRHLPYEAVLSAVSTQVRVAVEQDGYKVFEARR